MRGEIGLGLLATTRGDVVERGVGRGKEVEEEEWRNAQRLISRSKPFRSPPAWSLIRKKFLI